ncbi:hypothetical protein N7G274_006506 [Stereocaulon virgatum]|uniref:Uncharacterized protein n=1 Tax=Stereocaulon virgatum TaxID=373712 RepID=A0ABR4A3M9_9LECA
MAYQLGVQAIAGIAAGGFVVLVTTGICLVMIITRARDRRQRTRTDAIGGRRHSSRHLGSGHMSITDEDVMRMPGTRAAIRRSLQLQSTHSPYTPIASRDTLEARHTPRSALQTMTSHHADHEPIQAWPLPRRLQRSHASPVGKIQFTSASPTTERYKNNAMKAVETNDTIKTVDSRERDGIRTAVDRKNVQETVAGATVPPGADLTPKPLFYGQQRSISHGMITKLAEPDKINTPYAIEPGDPTPRAIGKPLLPRATSMYNKPGLAPADLVPPLPFQHPAKGPQRMKSPADCSTRRLSGGTIFSDNTSVLDDDTAKALSRTLTDRTSVGILSALNLEMAPDCLRERSSSSPPWDLTGHEGGTSPLGAVKLLTFRPPLTAQNSFRVSIHDSLPRSKSSGLSINMSLQGPSTIASSTDLSKETFTTPRTRLPIQEVMDYEQTRRESSLSFRRGRKATFNIYEDTKDSQSSTEPLQCISGNGSSLASSPMKARPSLVTDSPHRWETLTSMQKRLSSTFSSRGSFHKEQDSLSVSDTCMVLPLVPKMDIQVGNEGNKTNASPETVIRKQTNEGIKFRPPSTPTFNPQLAAPAPDDMLLRKQNRSPPTPSMATNSDDDDTSDLEAYTPTRRPSKCHPNRLKSIFDTSYMTCWPLPNTPDPLKLKIVEQQKQLPSVKQRSVFSINFPNFPDPPRDQPQAHDFENWRDPRTPVRGPRAPPPGFQYSPTRRSPSRGVSKLRGNSPSKSSYSSKILRKNVLALENAAALRRQNSEANSEAFTRGSKEHKRYLSIGSRETDVFEDLDRPVEGVEEVSTSNATEVVREKVVVKGPRIMFSRVPNNAKISLQERGLANCNKDDEVGLYDADGFLRE